MLGYVLFRSREKEDFAQQNEELRVKLEVKVLYGNDKEKKNKNVAVPNLIRVSGDWIEQNVRSRGEWTRQEANMETAGASREKLSSFAERPG